MNVKNVRIFLKPNGTFACNLQPMIKPPSVILKKAFDSCVTYPPDCTFSELSEKVMLPVQKVKFWYNHLKTVLLERLLKQEERRLEPNPLLNLAQLSVTSHQLSTQLLIFNPQLLIFNPQLLIFNPQLSILNAQFSIFNSLRLPLFQKMSTSVAFVTNFIKSLLKLKKTGLDVTHVTHDIILSVQE